MPLPNYEVAQPDTDLQNSSMNKVNYGTSTTNTFNTTNTAQFDQTIVMTKMTEIHEHMNSLHFMNCQENFPNLQINTYKSSNKYLVKVQMMCSCLVVFLYNTLNKHLFVLTLIIIVVAQSTLRSQACPMMLLVSA